MLINLPINCEPVEAGAFSECQALAKALDHYKNDVGLIRNDESLLYALDSLRSKLTLLLVAAVEGKTSEAGEAPFA